MHLKWNKNSQNPDSRSTVDSNGDRWERRVVSAMIFDVLSGTVGR